MNDPISPDFNRKLAGMIDHTLLKPEATVEQIGNLCREAVEFQFKSVCINPFWVSLAAQVLKNTEVSVGTVIGFPLGAVSVASKVQEAREAVENGAVEIDMVINIGALKSRQLETVHKDIQAVVNAVSGFALVKVILETCFLSLEEKITGCKLAMEAGAHFVKTSTGFGPAGALVEDIILLRRTVGPNMGVKASGGIRDFETALAMIQAGANRIGTSAGIKIVTQAAATDLKIEY
jgi:deoxyribose-phosphate aldolase